MPILASFARVWHVPASSGPGVSLQWPQCHGHEHQLEAEVGRGRPHSAVIRGWSLEMSDMYQSLPGSGPSQVKTGGLGLVTACSRWWWLCDICLGSCLETWRSCCGPEVRP